MAFKTRTFAQLNIGDKFYRIRDTGAAVCVKRFPRRYGLEGTAGVETIKPNEEVFVWTPDPTAEELALRRIESFKEWTAKKIRLGADAAEKFKSAMEQDLLYAIEWSVEGTTEKLASMKVAEALAQGFENGSSIDALLDYARDMAMRGARWPKRSTSPMANLVEQTKIAAWAEFVDDARYF